MPYSRRVKNVMSKVVVTAGEDDSMREAINLMDENRLSSLPVIDSRRRCVGILSASDLIHLARELGQEVDDIGRVSEGSRQWLIEKLIEHDMAHQKVSSRMTRSVAAIEPEANLAKAAGEMLRHRVHHLPVLDEHQRLLGIISTMDILTAFVEAAPE